MPRIKKSEKQEKKITRAKKAVKKVVKSELTIPVFNLEGKEEKLVGLPKEIFNVEIKPQLLAQYVRVYLANQRQGTASTKTRGEVAGSTRKIYRQKGTGRARHGAITAPIFVGGGVVGGPKPKDFSLKLNKKQKRKALFSALTLQHKNQNIIGLESSFLDIEPKTKIIFSLFKKIGFDNQKILLVLPKMEKNNLILSARNIPNISFINISSLNPYKILNSQKIIFVEGGLEVLSLRYGNKQSLGKTNLDRKVNESIKK